MSKTKLTIPIDSSTLVDAVCNTKFNKEEQGKILDSLMRQCKFSNDSYNMNHPGRIKTVKLWFSIVLIPFLETMAKDNQPSNINELIKQGEKALDIL